MSASGDTSVLGSSVRARRRELGLEQRDVSALAGVSRKFLSDLERGKASVQLDKVTAVLEALGLRLTVTRRGSQPATG
ncbi:MAG: type II toxin-antitoxin system Y4mF family antitoxin [Actinomycetota bacterium]